MIIKKPVIIKFEDNNNYMSIIRKAIFYVKNYYVF